MMNIGVNLCQKHQLNIEKIRSWISIALINLNKSILEYKEIQREKDRKRREDKLNDLGIEDKEDK